MARALTFVVLTAALLLAAAAGLIFSHRAASGPDPNDGVAKVADAISRWTFEKVPVNKRIVTLLVFDRAQEAEPLDGASIEPASRSWLASLFGRSPTAPPQAAALLQRFERDPSVVPMSFDAAFAASESRLVQALSDAIVKVHDAGAETDVVTVGRAVCPALKAVAALDGKVRQGVPVGVNKMISLGVDRTRLRRLDPFFANGVRGANIVEWATLYQDAASVPPVRAFDVSARGGAPIAYPADRFFALSADDLARALLGLIFEAQSIEAFAQAAEKDAQARAAAVERAEQPPQGRTFRAVKDGTVTARAAPQASPQGSMGMIVHESGVSVAAPEAERPMQRFEGEKPAPLCDNMPIRGRLVYIWCCNRNVPDREAEDRASRACGDQWMALAKDYYDRAGCVEGRPANDCSAATLPEWHMSYPHGDSYMGGSAAFVCCRPGTKDFQAMNQVPGLPQGAATDMPVPFLDCMQKLGCVKAGHPEWYRR